MIPEEIEIKLSKHGKGLFAKKTIKKKRIIFHFEGKQGNDASTNAEALQIDEDLFLESTASFDDYLNHSCEPNCFIDWKNLDLVAFRDIPTGEELSFDYNTSEYDLINLHKDCSFSCNCMSRQCKEVIKGFRYLLPPDKKKLLPFAAPYLQKIYLTAKK